MKKVFEKLVRIKKALIFAPPKQTSEGLRVEISWQEKEKKVFKKLVRIKKVLSFAPPKRTSEDLKRE